MRKVLYLTDLDGTLLSEGGEVSPRTREGLLRLLADGAFVTVASARSYFSIRKLFGDMPFQLPIIEFNGAFITDYATGRHLQVNSLGAELGEQLFDRIIAAGQRPFVCSFNGTEDCLHYDELTNGGMIWYEERRRKAGDTRLRRTFNLRSTMREEVVSLTVMDNDEAKIRALHAEIADAYGERLQTYCYENEYSKGTFWLTIHHENASKHIAMKTLRDRYAHGAELVAIGDNVNDLLMLQHADRGVAVENAVPELHGVADLVIGHHAGDAVVQFIEEDFAAATGNRS
jgi:hypothetical protein